MSPTAASTCRSPSGTRSRSCLADASRGACLQLRQATTDGTRASGYCSEQEQLEKWRPHAGATHTTREFFRSYEDAAKQAKETAQAVAQQVKTLRADDVIKPEILRQRVADAIAEGRAAVQKHQDRMEASLVALKAELSCV